jgi:MoxR-like ATPase
MAKIIIVMGPRSGETLPVKPSGFLIGRSNISDLRLEDDLAVSSNHARIENLGGQWMLRDLESANGTEVNGQAVSTMTLQDGDMVSVGETRFRFTAEAAESEAPAEAAAPAETPLAGIQEEEPPAESAPPAPEPVRPHVPRPAVRASEKDVRLVNEMSRHTTAIRAEVAKVIVGQQAVLDQILMAMIAGGHALLVGLPGMAKTLMVRTIAQVLDLEFKRIQFTPDLMPTDITGTDVLETNRDTGDKEFRFMQGPVFCNILLADEINRTPPKTQAALLEAMQEKRVTVGNQTYPLDAPFFVLATQNPIEQEGTYPLPEAQMDRFMFNIWVDYPEEHEEEQIVRSTTVDSSVQPDKVLDRDQVLQLQSVTRKVPVSDHVVKYAIRLVRATRPGLEKTPDFIKQYVSVGAGPRAGQFLILAAKARAILDGRIHVGCRDVKAAAIPVLRHRMFTNFAADSEGMTPMKLVEKLVAAVEEPSEKDYA